MSHLVFQFSGGLLVFRGQCLAMSALPLAQFEARDYPRREELGKDKRILLQCVIEIGSREVEDIARGGDGGDDGQRCRKKRKQSGFGQHYACVLSGDR